MIRRIAVLFLLMASFTFAQQGAPSKITFAVKNDAGQPVTDAAAEGCFPNLYDNGKAPSHDSFRGFTDTNGMFVATGDAVIGVYARFTKTGYYTTTIEHNRDVRVKLKWQAGWHNDRWEEEIPVLLKRIRSPIPMYSKAVEYVQMRKNSKDKVGPYTLSSLVAYDLLRGDMLPPDGRGAVPDMEFKWKMTIGATNQIGRALEYDTLCEIRMTNEVDGICRGNPDGGKGENRNEGSAYISAYEAPAVGYTNAISFYRNVRGSKAESNDDKHDACADDDREQG